MIATLFLAAAEMSGAISNAYPRITPQVAAERASHCGIGAVSVRSNAEMDTDTLVVSVEASITDQQLVCIDRAASFYDVELPTAVQPRFNAIKEARAAAVMSAEGRKWLASHNLLKGLPRYEPGITSDAVFTKKIERLCGATGAFQSRYGFHALSPEWLTNKMKLTHVDNGPFFCLMNAAWATGFEIGFIGNERFSE